MKVLVEEAELKLLPILSSQRRNSRIWTSNLPHCTIERGNAIIGKTPKMSITHNVANRSDNSELVSLKSNGSLSRFMTVNT